MSGSTRTPTEAMSYNVNCQLNLLSWSGGKFAWYVQPPAPNGQLQYVYTVRANNGQISQVVDSIPGFQAGSLGRFKYGG